MIDHLKVIWLIAALLWLIGAFVSMFSGAPFTEWALCLLLNHVCLILAAQEEK
jgi:hypothetical protein